MFRFLAIFAFFALLVACELAPTATPWGTASVFLVLATVFCASAILAVKAWCDTEVDA